MASDLVTSAAATGPTLPDREVFVPGRICLFGEHSDWAGTYRRVNPSITAGRALVSGTQEGIYARVKRNNDGVLRVSSTLNNGEKTSQEMKMDIHFLLQLASEGGFFSYAAGVAAEFLTNFNIQGLDIDNYKTTLPIQKGLSSSAAFCVLVARAYNLCYDLHLSIRGEMDYAYRGERNTPSKCGRLDQCCAYGSNLIVMAFDGDRLETDKIVLKEKLWMVIVDLKKHKDTKKILEDLNACYPNANNALHEGVHRVFGPINQQIVQQCIHLLCPEREHELTPHDPIDHKHKRNLKIIDDEDDDPDSPHKHGYRGYIDDIKAGLHSPSSIGKSMPEKLGKLMKKAQGYFDEYACPACPSELKAPFLHQLLAYPAIQPHIWGGKGIGSQGDGSAQLLARSEADQQHIIEILEKDLHVECMKLTLG